MVRNLRERVTIVPADRMSAARWPAGIETIWKNQITDEKGFERIYVATPRSVGVGARLNPKGIAEFWTGSEWKLAPKPLIGGWILESFAHEAIIGTHFYFLPLTIFATRQIFPAFLSSKLFLRCRP